MLTILLFTLYWSSEDCIK